MKDIENLKGLFKAVGMAMVGAIVGALFLASPIGSGEWEILLPTLPLALAGTAVFSGLVWEILNSHEDSEASRHAEERGHTPPTVTPGLKAA